MTSPSISGIARTLNFYARLQEVTADNLANASSEAFKAIRLRAIEAEDGSYPVPMQALDLSQGPLRDTGRALDLALEGPGFFVVRTAAGDRLMRGGGLVLDATGRLTDRHGDPLLDVDGRVLVVPPGELMVHHDGTVEVDGAVSGRLQLVTAGPGELLKEGHGRFVATAPPAALPPDARPVRQGVLEEANVDPLRGMVDLILIQRAYAANVEALKTLDGVLGSVVGDVGRI